MVSANSIPLNGSGKMFKLFALLVLMWDAVFILSVLDSFIMKSIFIASNSDVGSESHFDSLEYLL